MDENVSTMHKNFIEMTVPPWNLSPATDFNAYKIKTTYQVSIFVWNPDWIMYMVVYCHNDICVYLLLLIFIIIDYVLYIISYCYIQLISVPISSLSYTYSNTFRIISY